MKVAFDCMEPCAVGCVECSRPTKLDEVVFECVAYYVNNAYNNDHIMHIMFNMHIIMIIL